MTLTVFATALVTGCKGNAQTYDLHKTLALVIIIGIIAAFFALALFTNLLRDDVNDLNLYVKPGFGGGEGPVMVN